MKTNNISPEVKTGIYNIVSAVKKHAEAAEQLKNTAASRASDIESGKNPYIRDIFAPQAAENTTPKKRTHRYPKNPYAVSWPKDSPFYLPWHERIIKYLKFMFK